MIDESYCAWFFVISALGGTLGLLYYFHMQYRRLVRAAHEYSNKAVPYYRMYLEIGVRVKRDSIAPRDPGYGPEVAAALEKYLPKCRDLRVKQFLLWIIWLLGLFPLKWLLFSCGLCRTH